MGPLLIDEIARLRRRRRDEPIALLLLLALAAAFAASLAAALASLRPVRRRIASWRRPLLVELRLPRALLALAYGATLGASGAAIQALFANPLASPDLTGTTSGAALGAVVTAYLFGFAAPIALVDRRRSRARSARWRCCSRWPGRRRRPRPCCSPASRSARWPGR